MGKLPSEKTQLRNAKSEVRRVMDANRVLLNERDHYRVRATKAEQECAEWKTRFDALLRRDEVKS